MDWTRGRTIGRGSTATVSISWDNRTGKVFAVKSAELSNSEFLRREERILSALMCPQIVGYKGSNISSENGKLLYNLFLEYAPGGMLTNAIRDRRGGGMEEREIRSYARAILLGLEYLHSNGIVHCDIKSQNVLITNDGAKIADFGCARRVAEVSPDDWVLTMPVGGTPVYMAPEVARGEEQCLPSDVWALGCTVIEMATGRPPWADVSDPLSALYRIGFSSDVPEIPQLISKQCKDFLSKCLKRNPTERWSASELLKHEFFLEEIETHNLESPTSVLNRGFWNSIERLEETWNSTQKSCSNSAKERIRKLSEGSSEMINWAWDETWITVRSNGSQEDCYMSSSGNEISSSVATDTKISSASTEEYNRDVCIPYEFITSSEINTCNTSSRNNRSSTHEEECKFRNYKFCKNISSMNKKFCFQIPQLHAQTPIICLYLCFGLLLQLLQESSLFLAITGFKFNINRFMLRSNQLYSEAEGEAAEDYGNGKEKKSQASYCNEPKQ